MSPQARRMPACPSKITLVSIYAIVTTIGLSHQYVRDISIQLQEKNQAEEGQFYEKHFLPTGSRPLYDHNISSLSSNIIQEAAGAPTGDFDNPTATFPIRQHVVTQGKPRTATTLLFNMVAVSHFLYLAENNPDQIPGVELSYWQRPKGYRALDNADDKTFIIKAHISLDNFLSPNAVVFTAAKDRAEATSMKEELESEGHSVAFVQDLETVKQDGVPGLVQAYVTGYGLSKKLQSNLNEYFTNWELLRQCCGQQMSVRWRNDMMPEKFKIGKFGTHPTCATYDIDSIEQAFMNTELYSLIEKYPNIQPLNKPSLNDGNLNGTYCSSYNYLVRTQGLSIWGQPGGRPVRTHLDGAIKAQMKQKRENLKPEAHYLFPSSDEESFAERLRKMWKRPDKEKRAWLRTVLASREGGKTWSDYDIESTAASADEGVGSGEADDVVDTNEQDEGGGSDEDEDGDEADNEEVGDVDSNASEEEQGTGSDGAISQDKGVKTANENSEKDDDISDDMKATGESDATHAIFLISFGEEAAKSTLVERCILSLRRRGAWDGYVVVLTDASLERYQNEFDDNVIIMQPQDEHLNAADGTPFKYTKENTSLKPKRFKTFIIDYMGMDKRLDSVDLIYYLDIDILAGDSMGTLFSEIERKYSVSREERSGGSSKLYFFTPLSKEWPFQGGTFIVERRSSQHCLELWRKEIDDMTKSGRGRDQDALRTIHERIQSGEESKCELVRMENENFVNFPTPRTFDKLIRQTSYPSLIHISNSVFAKRIDEEAQTKYIHKVLKLSEEEKKSGKYGKSIVRAKKSDM